MGALPVSNSDFVVESQAGPYEVDFTDSAMEGLSTGDRRVILIDQRVLDLYGNTVSPPLDPMLTIAIKAVEETKSLEQIPAIVEQLVTSGIRRSDELVAVGGGITQDVAAFAASIMFRGMDWSFVPTTLLAQSDSCIGSKSSINAAGIKNLVGTFQAPRRVTIDLGFLQSLDDADIRSGIGEMLKVHAIAGPQHFDQLAAEYEELFVLDAVMLTAIRRSLLFKRELIQIDEFDRGPRRVMNYGHSFGHAIEIATDYGIPHGIAITVGMDLANYVSAQLGVSGWSQYERMHSILALNFSTFDRVAIDPERLLAALSRDKKNSATHLRLVLVAHDGTIGLQEVKPNGALAEAVREYLSERTLG